MNKEEIDKLNDFMLQLGEIVELQECMVDVMENCMFRDKRPYYGLTLVKVTNMLSNKLYKEIDEYTFPYPKE